MKRTKGAVIPTREWQGKRDLSRLPARVAVLLGLLLVPVGVGAAEGPAVTFDELKVKEMVFREVRVLSASATTLTVKHRDGLAQIPLRDLSPDLQARFGFDPQAARETEARLAAESAARLEAARKREAGTAAVRAFAQRESTPVERAMRRFGTPATWGRVDLRPKFREWELSTKDQGLRPSCSVFAVVNALEFQNAQLIGRGEKLSEEYLIWATRRALGMTGDASSPVSETGVNDAGFALSEVVGALRTYGICLQLEMPNQFGVAMSRIAPPSEAVVRSARERRQVFTHSIPGRDNAVRIENFVHALNENVPVVVGLRWPKLRTLKGALIDTQTPIPGYAHAVTLIGYYNDSGVPDETRFIFRNSWGVSWGAAGCGFVELRYLREHLVDAVLLEVRAPGT